ncbi:MAG TPA: hypothetical protein VGD39_20710 [Nocardioides sp.]
MSRLTHRPAARRARTSAAVLTVAGVLAVAACTVPRAWLGSEPPGDSTAPEVAPVVPTLPVTAPPTSPVATPPVATAPPTAPPLPPPDTPPAWENLFVDHFDGPVGTAPGQWHPMTGWNGATLNGLGQLEVAHLAQIRSTSGWTLPAGTRVRVSGSIVMPDTSSNYAALWVQHPNPSDPREIDVIESYGPRKSGGAQLGSHLCYDATLDDAVDECGAAGLSPELWPVARDFPRGAKPWDSSWEYHAEFTVGGDQVHYTAQDGAGHQAYAVTSTPDPRRVPGNAVPFHLRLSNKDVDPEHALAGGSRHSMLVDWVTVEVLYPTAAG